MSFLSILMTCNLSVAILCPGQQWALTINISSQTKKKKGKKQNNMSEIWGGLCHRHHSHFPKYFGFGLLSSKSPLYPIKNSVIPQFIMLILVLPWASLKGLPIKFIMAWTKKWSHASDASSLVAHLLTRWISETGESAIRQGELYGIFRFLLPFLHFFCCLLDFHLIQ